jgi:hypothetical protein
MSLEAMSSVYSYFFPEVRNILQLVPDKLNDTFYLTTTKIEGAKETLKYLLEEEIPLPKTEKGTLDLDMLHEPIIDRIIKSYKILIPDLNFFKSRYYMAGSSQGIFHTLVRIKVENKKKKLYILEGEYEGYREYGKTLGLEFTEVGPEDKIHKLEKGIWFISNPSARDGNIISNYFIESICNDGHEVILDLSYVGLTKPHMFRVDHPNISTVFLSFSKPYGVFRFRIGGFAFSKKPIDSLYANKWYKSIPGLLTSLQLVEMIPPGSLYEKYSKLQKEILSKINKEHSLSIQPSDVFLLGYLKDKGVEKEQIRLISEFKRGCNYRFCLTPYFEMMERGAKNE